MGIVIARMEVEGERIDRVPISDVDVPGLYYMTERETSHHFSCKRYHKVNKAMIVNLRWEGGLWVLKHIIILIVVW